MGFKKVLVAIDGYEPSMAAFKKAVELIDPDGEIVVLQVVEEAPLLPAEKMLEVEKEGLITSNPIGLVKIYAQQKGLKVKPIKKDGPVAAVILQVAKEEDVEAIFLGDSGRKGFEKLYFGSVAQAVAENSDRPVMITKKGWINIADLIDLAFKYKKELEKEEEIVIEEVPAYDPEAISRNFSFMFPLFVLITIIYFGAGLIASKPFKNIAAIPVAGLPLALWGGIFLIISGIILTRIYIKKFEGGEA